MAVLFSIAVWAVFVLLASEGIQASTPSTGRPTDLPSTYPLTTRLPWQQQNCDVEPRVEISKQPRDPQDDENDVVLECSGSFDESVALFRWLFKKGQGNNNAVTWKSDSIGGMAGAVYKVKLSPNTTGMYRCEAQGDHCPGWGSSKWIGVKYDNGMSGNTVNKSKPLSSTPLPLPRTTTGPFHCSEPPSVSISSEATSTNGTSYVDLTCSGSFDPHVALFKWLFKRNDGTSEEAEISQSGGIQGSVHRVRSNTTMNGKYRCQAQSDVCNKWGTSDWLEAVNSK